MPPAPHSKPALRKTFRAARAAVPALERRRAADRAARHLVRAVRRWQARDIALYLSFGAELDTGPLIRALRAAGRRLYVPRIGAPGRMRFVPLGRALRRNRHGIDEPVAAARAPRLDLLILPLVAFDGRGHRLGMGGGYYDRLLAGTRPGRPRRVGFAYALQEAGRLPLEAHDARLDAIVTEHGLRKF